MVSSFSRPCFSDLSSVGQMDVDATIKETAKDATKGSVGEASEVAGDRTDGITASGAPNATSVPESSAAGETVGEDQCPLPKPPSQADI